MFPLMNTETYRCFLFDCALEAFISWANEKMDVKMDRWAHATALTLPDNPHNLHFTSPTLPQKPEKGCSAALMMGKDAACLNLCFNYTQQTSTLQEGKGIRGVEKKRKIWY